MSNQQTNTTENQTACGSELNNSMDLETQAMEEATATVAHFIGEEQGYTIGAACRGEEGEYFVKMVLDLAKLLQTMPKTGEQDGLGDQAVVHLHYFMGGKDWYITERDIEDEQLQAFGLADFGFGGELGYINLVEIVQNGAELDLYWTPKTLAAIQAKRR